MKTILSSSVLLLSISSASLAEWTMYRADVRRSGVTTNSLEFPLKKSWIHDAPSPEQAWTGPAKWDAYSGNSGLQSMRNFDPCYYVTGRDNLVFYGSSADNGIHCIDASTGKERWVFFTDSAVRQPPTLHGDLAIAGSDDGYVYAVKIKDGTLAWKMLAAPRDHRIASNGKLISLWPVRTGVTLHDGKAYFAASLTPWESSLLWCVDPKTGKTGAQGTWKRELKGVTLQGASLIGQGKLFSPQGRAAPLVYDLADGSPKGSVGHAGGVFCLLDESGRLIAGPQNQRSKDDQIRVVDPATNQHLVTFNGATRVVIAGDLACVQNGKRLRCFDYRKSNELHAKINAVNAERKKLAKQLAELKKKKEPTPDEKKLLEELPKRMDVLANEAGTSHQALPACEKWQIDFPIPHDLIVAGNTVIAGIDDEVRALNLSTGKLIWSSQVKGRAMGLAVINGRLYVSTHHGDIHAFVAP